MDLELKDKVAVITGGSVGIGLAVAEGLAAEGVHLVLAARQEDRVKTEAKRVTESSKSAQWESSQTSPLPLEQKRSLGRRRLNSVVPIF